MKAQFYRSHLRKGLRNLPNFALRTMALAMMLIWWALSVPTALFTENTLPETLVVGYMELWKLLTAEIVD